MQKTKIEYLTHTWNPIAMRCTPVSSGCAHCWHLRMADRLAKNLTILPGERLAYWEGPPVLREKELAAPLRLRKPARIGVQFMGDLFHRSIPEDIIRKVFDAMFSCDRHTYFVLTKRPTEMKSFIEGGTDWPYCYPPGKWDHIYLGVSVSGPDDLHRVDTLLQLQAAHHWVSYEPALGPVDASSWLSEVVCYRCGSTLSRTQLAGCHTFDCPQCGPDRRAAEIKPRIHFLACGGETGPGARPMRIEWARNVVQQCRNAGVPVFVKQLTINGKISKDMSEWPEDLRVREMPE